MKRYASLYLDENVPNVDLFDKIYLWALGHKGNSHALSPTDLVRAVEPSQKIGMDLYDIKDGEFSSYGEAVGFIVDLILKNSDVFFWRIRFLTGKLSQVVVSRDPTNSRNFMIFHDGDLIDKNVHEVYQTGTREMLATR